MNLLPQDIKIIEPPIGIPSSTPLGQIIGNLIGVIFMFGGLALLAMLIWGALLWITAQGQKDQLDQARAQITHAFIGFVILAISVVIARIAGEIVGIPVLEITFPTLSGK